MKWIGLIGLTLFLSACGYVYNSEVVTYRTVNVDPIPATYVVVQEPAVDVTTTEIDYY